MTTVLLKLVGPGLFIVLRMLTQAGSHDKPSLSAWPSHVVKLGQDVELKCNYHNEPCMFKIYKEIGDPIPQLHNKTSYGRIILGPVTPAYGGIYRCYNYNQYPNRLISHSDPLKIIISGIYRKPFLSVLSTPLVNTEEKVTMKCHSGIMFDTFILTSHKNNILKDFYQLPAESHIGGSHASFSIGPVTPDHAGTYTCYGSYEQISYEWSESSVPIDICITGLYKKPSLSALMGPGENITLSCISDLQFDMFHLSVDGVPQEHGLPGVHSHGGTFQANFFLVPVIQAGNYSCYGSFRNSSHVWSSPSDPLYLPVTVNSTRNSTSCIEPDSKSNNHRSMDILMGLSVPTILFFLVIYLYTYCLAKKSNSQEQASECHQSSLSQQDQKNTANMDQESEVKTMLKRQNPERQEVKEVLYLEFDQMIFKQKLTTPISQIPNEFSTDHSVYMEVRKC